MQEVEKGRLLNCKMAAEYLGMTEAALRKNLFLRRLQEAVIRIGGRIYLDRKRLDGLLDRLGTPHRGKK